MEENQIQNELESSDVQTLEPTQADNSQEEQFEEVESSLEQIEEGQSLSDVEKDPSKDLILGKFKSVEDLVKAYEELQKRQGQSSEELGNLRKEMAGVNEIKNTLSFFNAKKDEFFETIQRDKEKFSAQGYFEDPVFKEIYQEALLVYGSNLDTDRMVDLIEKYVSGRIQAYEKKKLANNETQKVLDSMNYAKNLKTKFTPPKKSFDEMTPQEVDELLDRLI